MFRRAIYPNKKLNIAILVIGIVYVLIMLYLLFLRGRTVSVNEHYMYNLVPFRTIRSYIVYRDHYGFRAWFDNLFGNIVLFIPIGLFLPVLNRRFLRIRSLVITTLCVIFIIELLQMISRVGSFDMDDLILNTCGASIGLLVIKLCLQVRIRGRKLGGS